MNIKVAIEQLKGVKNGALPSVEAIGTILDYLERYNQLTNLIFEWFISNAWTINPTIKK